ncbi:AAA family ATPase [Salinispirillum marinum]|uniref:AAA family ATPase n=2 Tax=Saccharospirillaceae TaxID=255527 RepID=A0ABV8BE40_9GAMM
MSELPKYVDYYGLNSDPFDVDAVQPFVPVAGRQKAVDTLVHLLQFSDDIVFIAGPVASGKSAILEQLVSQLPENIDLVMVDVSEATSDKELLWDVATQFKLQPDRTHSTQRLQLMIQAHCQSLHGEGQIPTLAIDDIDELPSDILASLSPVLHGGLNGDAGLRLVGLAADAAEIRRELSALGFASGQVIELPLLKFSDAVNIIQGYFAAAGITSGIPFDVATLKRLYKSSGGRPGHLVDAVRDHMLVETQRGRRRKTIPWPHLVAGAVIASALMLAVLYRSGGEDVPTTDTFELLPSEPVAQGAELDAAAVRERLAQAMAERSVTDSRSPDASPSNGLTEPMSSSTVSPTPPSEKTPEQETRSNAVPLSADKLAELSSPEPSTTNSSAPVTAVPSETASETTPVEVRPVAPPVTTTSTAASSGNTAASRPTAPAAVSGASPYLAPSWLRNANNSHYTLQVLGARQEQNVLEFIATHSLSAAQAGYYRTELQGQPWFVLVYGSYPDADAARAAIATLSADLRAAQPWPRPISAVKSDLPG